MKIGTLIRTLIARFLLLILTIIFFIPVIILMLMPERWRYNRFVFFFVNFFYWVVLKSSLLPLTFVNWDKLPNEPVIFACNHQSSYDIPLLGVLARGTPHVWLARHELLKMKLLGWILPYLAVIINVSSPRKALQSLRHAVDLVKGKDRHVMIFPEGQRYIDGNVHEFFRGFIMMAKLLDRPVVPVRIFGINKVYPPGSFLVYWHPVKVIIGPPFRFLPEDTDETFKQRVYQWFVEQTED